MVSPAPTTVTHQIFDVDFTRTPPSDDPAGDEHALDGFEVLVAALAADDWIDELRMPPAVEPPFVWHRERDGIREQLSITPREP